MVPDVTIMLCKAVLGRGHWSASRGDYFDEICVSQLLGTLLGKVEKMSVGRTEVRERERERERRRRKEGKEGVGVEDIKDINGEVSIGLL